MATIENTSYPTPHSGGQGGNAAVWSNPFQKSGVVANDVLKILQLPAGARVDDAKLVFDDCGTGMTLKFGYMPVNSDDGPSAVDDYWGTGIDVATAAGVHRSAAHPITFDYPVWVTATVASAAFTGSPKLSAVMSGEATGTK
jgi:hypothetical protein